MIMIISYIRGYLHPFYLIGTNGVKLEGVLSMGVPLLVKQLLSNEQNRVVAENSRPSRGFMTSATVGYTTCSGKALPRRGPG